MGFTKYVYEVKDDPVLQVSCQEHSMSSKNTYEGSPILDTLLIKISKQNFQVIFIGVKQGHPCYQVSCQEPSMSSKYQHKGHLDTLLMKILT